MMNLPEPSILQVKIATEDSNIMKVLISPLSLEEAHIVAEGGCDILDIKNVKEGSLGAQ